MKKRNNPGDDRREPERSHLLLNIAKLLFLIAVLVGAWFVLDWLISDK